MSVAHHVPAAALYSSLHHFSGSVTGNQKGPVGGDDAVTLTLTLTFCRIFPLCCLLFAFVQAFCSLYREGSCCCCLSGLLTPGCVLGCASRHVQPQQHKDMWEEPPERNVREWLPHVLHTQWSRMELRQLRRSEMLASLYQDGNHCGKEHFCGSTGRSPVEVMSG